MLNIMDGDVLLVEDPDVISEKAIEILKENVKVIVYKKPVSKKVESRLPFVFVDSKKLNIEENGYFALVDKKEFDLEKNKVNMLSKVIQDYKNERLFN
jgi:predicted RNase H-like nuclease (RuvC/YqgF family)